MWKNKYIMTLTLNFLYHGHKVDLRILGSAKFIAIKPCLLVYRKIYWV